MTLRTSFILAMLLLGTILVPTLNAGTETPDGEGQTHYREDFESFLVGATPSDTWYTVTSTGTGSSGVVATPANGSRAYQVDPPASGGAMRGFDAEGIDLCESSPTTQVGAQLHVADSLLNPQGRLAVLPTGYIPNAIGPGIFLLLTEQATGGADPMIMTVELRNETGFVVDSEVLHPASDGILTGAFHEFHFQFITCTGTTQVIVRNEDTGRAVSVSGTLTLPQMGQLVFGTVAANSDDLILTLDDLHYHDVNDGDEDLIPDFSDNCPVDANPGQEDTDMDGMGDVCEDSDGDGVYDDVDNCPVDANPGQEDTDMDGIGDVCEDSDGDGVYDDVDNCPNEPNPGQSDTDGDGVGDPCDEPLILGGLSLIEDFEDDTPGMDPTEPWYTYLEANEDDGVVSTAQALDANSFARVNWGGTSEVTRFHTDVDHCDLDRTTFAWRFTSTGGNSIQHRPSIVLAQDDVSEGDVTRTGTMGLYYWGPSQTIRVYVWQPGSGSSFPVSVDVGPAAANTWYNVTLETTCNLSGAASLKATIAGVGTATATGSLSAAGPFSSLHYLVMGKGDSQDVGTMYLDNLALISDSITWANSRTFTNLEGFDVDRRGLSTGIVRYGWDGTHSTIETIVPKDLSQRGTHDNGCNFVSDQIGGVYARSLSEETGKEAAVAFTDCFEHGEDNVDRIRIRNQFMEEDSPNLCSYCNDDAVEDFTIEIPNDIGEIADVSTFPIQYSASTGPNGFQEVEKTLIVFPFIEVGTGRLGAYGIQFVKSTAFASAVDRDAKAFASYMGSGETIPQMCVWRETSHPDNPDLVGVFDAAIGGARIYRLSASFGNPNDQAADPELSFSIFRDFDTTNATAIGCASGYFVIADDDGITAYNPLTGQQRWNIPDTTAVTRGLVFDRFAVEGENGPGYTSGAVLTTDDVIFIRNGTITCTAERPPGSLLKIDMDRPGNWIWIGIFGGTIYRYDAPQCLNPTGTYLYDYETDPDQVTAIDTDGDGIPDYIDNDPNDADCDADGIPDGEDPEHTCNGYTCNFSDCNTPQGPGQTGPQGTIVDPGASDLVNGGICGAIDLRQWSALLEVPIGTAGAIITLLICLFLAVIILAAGGGSAGFLGGIALGGILAWPLCLIAPYVAVTLALACVGLAVFTWSR